MVKKDMKDTLLKVLKMVVESYQIMISFYFKANSRTIKSTEEEKFLIKMEN